MKNPNLIRTKLYPYHVTTRTNNKEWFEIPLEKVWRMCMDSLKQASSVYPVEVISFVLMANHYHLILKTPNSDLDKFMYEFNKVLSLLIRSQSNRIDSVFGGRYKWCLIKSQSYLYNCYRYVYQNPVRAGLSRQCENYPYSSLFYLIGNKSFPVILHDAFGFKDEFALTWINKKVDISEVMLIKKGLRKFEVDKTIKRSTYY